MTFELEQAGSTFEVTPLSTGETVVDYYGDGHGAGEPTHLIERDETSNLLLFDGPDGLSIVVTHDDTTGGGDGTGGAADFTFEGLPSDGSWVFEDDPSDFTDAPNVVTWEWLACCSDGGAFRGGLEDGFEVTVTPDFIRGVDRWFFLSGDAADPDRIPLAMDQSATIRSGPGGTSRVTGAATALTFIPGESEAFGDSRNSAIPDFVDRMFHGDHRIELPDDLGDALDDDKLLPEFDGPEFDRARFPTHRVRNTIEIEFETDGNEIDLPGNLDELDEIPNVSFDDRELSPVTLEGEEGDENPLLNVPEWFEDDPRIDEPWQYETSDPAGVWNALEAIEVDGVEGIRASQIFGADDVYVRIMAERYASYLFKVDFYRDLGVDPTDPENVVLDQVLLVTMLVEQIPKMYTFLELAVMADGSTVAALWDGSPYPRQVLYVGPSADEGTKVGHSDFEKGDEWEPNQLTNDLFDAWGIEGGITAATPFVDPIRTPILSSLADHPYENGWNTGVQPHPMVDVEVQEGDELTESALLDAISEPLFPF